MRRKCKYDHISFFLLGPDAEKKPLGYVDKCNECGQRFEVTMFGNTPGYQRAVQAHRTGRMSTRYLDPTAHVWRELV